MGKWSTYRKRGCAQSSAGLQPPPAPLLQLNDEAVQGFAQGNNDTGGSFYLESSIDEGINWAPEMDQLWAPFTLWGDRTDFLQKWLRMKETGNGTAYEGDSPWSDILDLII